MLAERTLSSVPEKAYDVVTLYIPNRRRLVTKIKRSWKNFENTISYSEEEEEHVASLLKKHNHPPLPINFGFALNKLKTMYQNLTGKKTSRLIMPML